MNTKTSILIYPLLAMGVLLMITNSCKKDDDNILPIQFNPELNYETMSDIDGNVYRTIKIGTQTWMAENLKVTKYRNGDTISNVPVGFEWLYLTTGAYCEDGIISNCSAVFGKLYNWYAVADSRNIAPTGWHVASDAEWTILTTFLGGEDVAGGKLKEKGTTHWRSQNVGATNETGFTALPAGYRYIDRSYDRLGDYGYFWSSSEYIGSEACNRILNHGINGVGTNFSDKSSGFSVRCIKD